MNPDVLRQLHTLSGEVLEGEPMSRHTSFRIGGPAEVMFLPASSDAAKAAVLLLKEQAIPFRVMGNGSNLLVADEGLSGVVIKISALLSRVKVEGNSLRAQGGASLARVAGEAAKAGLTGLEFASGIPGTVGGGVTMNAGAYGGELKDVLTSVTWMDEDGEIYETPVGELSLGYRTSRFSKGGAIILEAEFLLAPGDEEEIRAHMADLNGRRKEKQPLEYPSAGSTFKRPEGHFAGALIQDAGLKGYSVGDAQVSEKHAGFVINKGAATAKDVLGLIAHIQKTVKEKFGVSLETEVKFWGDHV